MLSLWTFGSTIVNLYSQMIASASKLICAAQSRLLIQVAQSTYSILADLIVMVGFCLFWALFYVTIRICICFLIQFVKNRSYAAIEKRIQSMPCIAPHKAVSQFRQEMVDRPFTLEGHRPNVSNVHSIAAQRRSAARHWIDTAIVTSGRVNFALNSSNSDLLKGADGSRKLRTAKDFVYYKQCRDDDPTERHHFSAVDDLDWYSADQYNDLLVTSLDNDSSIFSYMHMPTQGSFKTDEFYVDYDHVTETWVSTCADEEDYAQSMWDNTRSITSHISVRKMTWRICVLLLFLSFIFATATFYYLYPVVDAVAVTPFGTYCFNWFNIWRPSWAPFKMPEPFQYAFTFAGDQYNLQVPSFWNLVPRKLRFSHVWVPMWYPWIVDCPDTAMVYASSFMAFVSSYFLLYSSVLLSGLRSGFHFNFHIACGESRTIWIQHPAVKFGFFRTLWFSLDVLTLLPRRLKPTVTKVPPTELEPNGTNIYSFSHIDHVSGERMYSYNLAGSPTTTVFDTKAYNVVKAHNMSQKKKMSVASFCIAYGNDYKDYWTTDLIIVGINAVTYETGHTKVIDYVRQPTVTNYRFRCDDFVEVEHEPVLKGFFSGATLGCTYIPQSTRGNTSHSIDTRINNVRPRDLPPSTSRFQQRQISAFLNAYKEDIGHTKVRMLSAQEVYDHQTKPGQRLTNEDAMSYTGHAWLAYTTVIGKITAAFQKTEAGMKPGDPRNITPMPDKVRLQNSRISLALSKNMKKTKWYAFGHTPCEVAAKVADHVSDDRTTHVGLGDYSRMDGTVNHLVREFDVAFLKSNFPEDEHNEIMTWYSMTYGNSVKAGHGVWYEQETSQASGDPYTSCLNTARNAFISFCCLLCSEIPGSTSRLSEKGAYKNLGLFGGDDSLQRNIDAAASVRCAAAWGFVLKFVLAKRGERVDFLARNYSPAVWDGFTDNVCSPLRMISKFHVSSLTDSFPKPVIAHMKARSILANDSLTYLVGDWMRKIVAQTKGDFEKWKRGAKATRVLMLDSEKQWNERWAECSGDIADTSYQHDNNLDLDWQQALFLEEFTYEALEEFQLYVEDESSRWDEPPVLAEHEAKPAASAYMANGEIVNPSVQAPIPMAYPVSDSEPCGNANTDGSSSSKAIDPSSEETKIDTYTGQPVFSKVPTTGPTGRRCKRADNCSGWYAGLKPCHAVVTGKHNYCKTCNDVVKPHLPKNDGSTPSVDQKSQTKPAASKGKGKGKPTISRGKGKGGKSKSGRAPGLGSK